MAQTFQHGWMCARTRERPLDRIGPAFAAALTVRVYDALVKQINCVCGKVVKGENDDELWERAQAHIRQDHPELVDKVSRKDILAQAEET